MTHPAPVSDQDFDYMQDNDHHITTSDMVKHMQRVETLCGVMRDLLLTAAGVPPFNMMISPEQIAELKAL